MLPAYIEERAIFARERANGGYSVAAYLLAHTAVEVPFLAALALAASVPVYFLVGLSLNDAGAGAANFFYFGNLELWGH